MNNQKIRCDICDSYFAKNYLMKHQETKRHKNNRNRKDFTKIIIEIYINNIQELNNKYDDKSDKRYIEQLLELNKDLKFALKNRNNENFQGGVA